jgi:hypothetical protein
MKTLIRLITSMLFVAMFFASKEASAQIFGPPTLYGWYTTTASNQTWNLGVNAEYNICWPMGFKGPVAEAGVGISLGHVTVNGKSQYQVQGNGNSTYQPSILVGCYSNSFLETEGFAPGEYYSNWTAGPVPLGKVGPDVTNTISNITDNVCWVSGIQGNMGDGSAAFATAPGPSSSGSAVLIVGAYGPTVKAWGDCQSFSNLTDGSNSTIVYTTTTLANAQCEGDGNCGSNRGDVRINGGWR